MFESKTVGDFNILLIGGTCHLIVGQSNVFFQCGFKESTTFCMFHVSQKFSISKHNNSPRLHCRIHNNELLDYKCIWPFQFIARGKHDPTNGLFRLETNSLESHIHMVEEDSIDLMHSRLGHVEIQTRHEMMDTMEGIPPLQTKSRPCPHCMEGKQRRSNVPNRLEIKATHKNEIVHSNLCGPMPTISLYGSNYFQTFTNNYSRKTQTYFLKSKLQAFQTLKNFKSMMGKEKGENIKTLRVDKGGEYVSKDILCHS